MNNLSENIGSGEGRRRYSLKIDDQVFHIENPEPTGRELLDLVGRAPADYFLVFVVPGAPDRVVELDEPFDLATPGTEEFTLVSRERRFAIQIDERNFTVVGPLITGQSILDLAGKSSETHFVTQIIVGADDIVVGLGDSVNVSEPGKERFTIVAKPKPCQIVVNTRKHPWNKDTISFEDVVKLAYPDWTQDDPNTTRYTVKFRAGDPSDPEGSLVAGKSVKVRCGMVFDVDRTNRS